MKTLLSLAVGLGLGTLSSTLLAEPDGRALFEQYCTVCHDRGMEYPGTARLADRWPQQPSLLDREPLEPDYVRRIVRHGLNMMPPFRPSEISARELDALARYLSTSAAQKNKIEDKEK